MFFRARVWSCQIIQIVENKIFLLVFVVARRCARCGQGGERRSEAAALDYEGNVSWEQHVSTPKTRDCGVCGLQCGPHGTE